MGTFKSLVSIICLGVLPASSLQAAPAQYQFSGDTFYRLNAPIPDTTKILYPVAPLTISGSFFYDASAAAYPEAYPGAFYGGAFTDLSGSVEFFDHVNPALYEYNFSDPDGLVSVYNDSLEFDPSSPELVDMLQLAAEVDTSGAGNFSGFQVAEEAGIYELRNVRIYWIETPPSQLGFPDFLSDELLPATLPPDGRRPPIIAMDFIKQGDSSGAVHSFVAIRTTLTPVPIPAAGWLLLTSLGGLVVVKRRKT